MVRPATISGGVILGVCAALVSVGRCDAFKDDVHFSQQWLRSNPGTGNSTEERRADQSLFGRIHERWFNIDAALVNAQYNLEFALAKQGRFETSIVTFDFWAGHLEIFKAEGMHYAILDLWNMALQACRWWKTCAGWHASSTFR